MAQVCDHALVCSSNLPRNVQAGWASIQTQAAQLLSAWMAMCRDSQLCSPFAETPVVTDPLSNENPGIHVPHVQQLLALHDAVAIDIRWNRPIQISQLTAWGGSPQEFNLLIFFRGKMDKGCTSACNTHYLLDAGLHNLPSQAL